MKINIFFQLNQQNLLRTLPFADKAWQKNHLNPKITARRSHKAKGSATTKSEGTKARARKASGNGALQQDGWTEASGKKFSRNKEKPDWGNQECHEMLGISWRRSKKCKERRSELEEAQQINRHRVWKNWSNLLH